MSNYTLSVPDACKTALAEYREYNDPVRQFVEEILPRCTWDLLPFTFLYDLYRAWFEKYIPSGSPQSRNTFIKDLLIAIQGNELWECPDKNKKIKTSNRLDYPEMMIQEFRLTTWMNPRYTASYDKAKMCTPDNLSESYRGLTRVPNSIPAIQNQKGDDDTNHEPE